MKTFLSILLLAAQSALAQFSFEDLPFMAGAVSAAAFPPESAALQVWWKADDFNTNANGTAMTNITDKSGNNANGTNVIATSPFLTNNVINSRSAFAFVNRVSFIQSNVWKGVLQGEIFLVLKSAVTNQTGEMYRIAAVNRTGAEQHPDNSGLIRENFGNTGSVSRVGIGFPLVGEIITNWHIWNVHTKTNELIARYDGNLILGSDIAASSFTNSPAFGIDNVTTWNSGWLAELMIWTNILSDASREAVHAYLSAQYGIAYTNTLLCFYPTNFSNCVGWWKADDLHGVFADNAAVTNWPNAIAGGANWTNRTTASCPLFHSNLFNGQPALGFDAAVGNRRLILNTATIPLTNQTVLLVGRYTNNTVCVLSHSTTGNNQWRVREGGANATLLFNGNSYNSPTWPRAIGNLRLDAWSVNASNVVGVQNMLYGNTAAFTGTMDLNKVGSDNASSVPFGGDLSEIIVYQRALEPHEIFKLYHCYLKPKYALP